MPIKLYTVCSAPRRTGPFFEDGPEVPPPFMAAGRVRVTLSLDEHELAVGTRLCCHRDSGVLSARVGVSPAAQNYLEDIAVVVDRPFGEPTWLEYFRPPQGWYLPQSHYHCSRSILLKASASSFAPGDEVWLHLPGEG